MIRGGFSSDKDKKPGKPARSPLSGSVSPTAGAPILPPKKLNEDPFGNRPDLSRRSGLTEREQ